MRKPLRVLVLAHEDLVPPARVPPGTDLERAPWKTEHDVLGALRRLGHEATCAGVAHDLDALRDALRRSRPHVVFNLLEEFHSAPVYDGHVVAFLELARQRYTGCNPAGLALARDKALSKEILAQHGVLVPPFAVLRRGRRPRRPAGLAFPLVVKSLTDDGSLGIAQASLVRDDRALRDRAAFVHESLLADAIAEGYVEGREVSVGLMGNGRPRALPPWETRFTRRAPGQPAIATERVKWDPDYRLRHGIESGPARGLPPAVRRRVLEAGRRTYAALRLTGYARVDLRVTPEGRAVVLEANPNPQIARGEDFADSARAAGLSYAALLDRLVRQALAYRAPWQVMGAVDHDRSVRTIST
jgi:D-alanine-D-alanine ligase